MENNTVSVAPGSVLSVTQIIGSSCKVYSVWEQMTNNEFHSTQMTIDGVRMGRLGTRVLPPEIAKMPRGSDRYGAVHAFHTAQYEAAYTFINEQIALDGNGDYSMGEISVY